MLDFMEGQKILQQRIAELNAALKKHPSAMQWEFCTAEAGESYPPESGYIPVQNRLFAACGDCRAVGAKQPILSDGEYRH